MFPYSLYFIVNLLKSLQNFYVNQPSCPALSEDQEYNLPPNVTQHVSKSNELGLSKTILTYSEVKKNDTQSFWHKTTSCKALKEYRSPWEGLKESKSQKQVLLGVRGQEEGGEGEWGSRGGRR